MKCPSFKVTPTTGRAVTYDEESWKPSPEDTIKDKKESDRSTDASKSKTKRVRNYFKKCKNVLASSKSSGIDLSTSVDSSSLDCERSSWYCDGKIEENLNECEINELDDIFEDAQISLDPAESKSVFQVANIIEVRGPPSIHKSANSSESRSDKNDSVDEEKPKETTPPCDPKTASPVLSELQDQEDGEVDGDGNLGFREMSDVIPTIQAKSGLQKTWLIE
ncbi:hypothetical protein JTB14_028693 [Gonioctena quinquepunctata]|nr:hypothetical protein JTB14_028693 [Gonioctena quinquepunctata]